MLEVYMQNVWVFLGACSGLVIGLTKEGVDLFLSLKSVQGWKQIYTGTAAIRSKKVDNGSSTPFTSQGPIQTGIGLTAHQRRLAADSMLSVQARLSPWHAINCSLLQSKQSSSS